MSNHSSDVLIVGGGVVGLTAAYELARAAVTVTVLDKGIPGQEASWAGAGMIPPGGRHSEPGQLREWADLAAQRWPELSAELKQLSHVDNEYHRCGSVHVAQNVQEQSLELTREWEDWSAVAREPISRERLGRLIPGMHPNYSGGVYLPDAAQVRNPRHLQALVASCEKLGGRVLSNHPALKLIRQGTTVTGVQTPQGVYSARQVLIAAGPWSNDLLRGTEAELEVEPVRGQIVLLECQTRPFVPLLEVGVRYLVPRRDGYVLIGSTEERVGFVKETTEEGVDSLLDFAFALVPGLRQANIIRSWAGLRPQAKRGMPYVERLAPFDNLFVATGHFRAGLSLSPATALEVRKMLLGR